MEYRIIPLTNDPNQFLSCTLPINGKNITLQFKISYNTIANYWTMTVCDKLGNALISALPLYAGVYPAANILEQYDYLNIGSAVVVNVSNLPSDIPDDTNLGSDYYLVWTSNIR